MVYYIPIILICTLQLYHTVDYSEFLNGGKGHLKRHYIVIDFLALKIHGKGQRKGLHPQFHLNWNRAGLYDPTGVQNYKEVCSKIAVSI